MATATPCDFCGIVGIETLENDLNDFNFDSLIVKKKKKDFPNDQASEVKKL